MYYISKLKSEQSIIGLIPPIVFILIFGFVWVLMGVSAAFATLGLLVLLYACYSLMAYARTHSLAYLVGGLFQTAMGCFLLTSRHTFGRGLPPIAQLFLLLEVFFGLWLIYLLVTKRAKWRGREIFELAAAPVEEIGNGFTDRPRPVGKVEYSDTELHSFATFMSKHLIAVPYIESSRITFVPVKNGDEIGFMLGTHSDYSRFSWVAFDFEGNVSVRIAKPDYLSYKEALAFEPLCTSLGNLFVEFLMEFRRGNSSRITDRLDALPMGFFS